jgi:hypothetical protein
MRCAFWFSRCSWEVLILLRRTALAAIDIGFFLDVESKHIGFSALVLTLVALQVRPSLSHTFFLLARCVGRWLACSLCVALRRHQRCFELHVSSACVRSIRSSFANLHGCLCSFRLHFSHISLPFGQVRVQPFRKRSDNLLEDASLVGRTCLALPARPGIAAIPNSRLTRLRINGVCPVFGVHQSDAAGVHRGRAGRSGSALRRGQHAAVAAGGASQLLS